jgi:hypothetical protein
MSVDPDVSTTGQAYSYTGDDPVNGVDPLGLCWSLPQGVQGPCQSAPPGISYNSSCGGSAGSSVSDWVPSVIGDAGHGLDFSSGGLSGWSKYSDALGENGLHIGDEGLTDLANSGVAASDLARGAGPLGAGLTIGSDLAQGHGVPYAVGDAGSSTAGAWGGAAVGAVACGGPEDGVGIVCGAVGAFVGGGGAHWVYSKITSLF